MTLAVRAVLAFVFTTTLALWQSGGGCGYHPDPLKNEGEPCTRSDECRSSLTCRGGVCMRPEVDASVDPDAGPSDAGSDAGGMDAGPEAGVDAGDAGDPADGGDASMDGALPDGAPVDAGDGGAAPDAGDDAG